MPFTPFHFGPMLAIKALAPKRTSFVALCVPNIIFDMEPGIKMILGGNYESLHTYHLFWLCIPVAILTYLICTVLKKVRSDYVVTNEQIALGALIGSFTHVLLDSFYHLDMNSVLYGLISPDTIVMFCLLSYAITPLLFVLGNHVRHKNS